MRIAIVTGLALTLCCLAGAAGADTLNVPGDYNEINDAVQAAAPGDTVLVAAGTYNDCTHETEGPGSTPACVIMNSGVTLIGAGPEATIIDAEGLGRGIFLELVSDVRIENLQVTGAFAAVKGAGILIRQTDSSVQINDVKIFENGDGGIICIGASPVLSRIDFIMNYNKQGGGLALEQGSNAEVTDCLFDGNEAPTAAGIIIDSSNAILDDCVIQNNSTTSPLGNGGGILVDDSTPTITDCLILNNTAGGFGGGIGYLAGPGGTLTDSVIKGNTVTYTYGAGGGISCNESGPQITNTLIIENTITGNEGIGGGVDIQFNPAPTFSNCTIVNNSCGAIGSGGGISSTWGSTPTFDKCIIAFATVGEGVYCGEEFNQGNPTIGCTDIFGNAEGDAICGTDGGSNFSADPLFCGTVGFEYNLESASPCAPGNHPDGAGACDDALIGALPMGCTADPVYDIPADVTRLLGNMPNPFNPRTSIFFVLSAPGPASLHVYDLKGRMIQSFDWHELAAGQHEVVWDGRDQTGRDMPSGVYLYQLDAKGIKQTRRMSLIR